MEIKDIGQMRVLFSWVACYIAEHGVDAPWVEMKANIKKSTLHITRKF